MSTLHSPTSELSVNLVFCTLLEPDGPVQQLNASGTASDTILVSWKKPKPEHCNGNVDRYSVCHQRVNESLIGNSHEELERLNWPAELRTEETK